MTPPDQTGAPRQEEERSALVASFRPSRWPGLIWAVPLAALGVILWLGLQAFIQQGPSVTVRFATTGGLRPGHTKVEFRGVTVGHVSSVHLSRSLRTMTATLNLMPTMHGHLGRGTKFWLAGTHVSIADPASLKAIISGPHIEVMPRPGPTVGHFVALAQAPEVTNPADGETITLRTGDPGNLGRGAKIYLHHYDIGEVRDIRMQPDGQYFTIKTFIARKYEHLVNLRSRFWSAGAVHLAMTGNGPSLQLQSVPAILNGAIDLETPGPAPLAHAGAVFRLYASKSAALAAPGHHAVPFRIRLPGGPHGLGAGARVMLEGMHAGVVTAVRSEYDPTAAALDTRVRIALEPRLIGRATGHPWNLTHPAPQMHAMIAALVAHGLRARLASAVPVVGGKIIALDLVPHASPVASPSGTPPLIPAVSGSGSGAIMAQVSDILAKIDALPLPEIAHNIHDATRRLAALSASPRTRRTLERVDRTITHLDAITRQTDARWPTIMAEVSRSAREAGAALRSARAMLAQQSGASSGPETSTLPRALYELSRAARSLRSLTSYLSGHPNAVILGRGR
jgi:paraquat-inducible protein B